MSSEAKAVGPSAPGTYPREWMGHPWQRQIEPGTWPEIMIVRCRLCDLRRDALVVRGFDPDDDECPMLTPDTCRARGIEHSGVCRLPPHGTGDHRGLFVVWAHDHDLNPRKRTEVLPC